MVLYVPRPLWRRAVNTLKIPPAGSVVQVVGLHQAVLLGGVLGAVGLHGLDGAPGAAPVLFGGAGSRTGLALPGLAPLFPARLGGGGGALRLLFPGGA